MGGNNNGETIRKTPQVIRSTSDGDFSKGPDWGERLYHRTINGDFLVPTDGLFLRRASSSEVSDLIAEEKKRLKEARKEKTTGAASQVVQDTVNNLL